MAIVSTGFKSDQFLIKHLTKTFYFVLSFVLKGQIKSFGGHGLKALNFWLSINPLINYSHCYKQLIPVFLIIQD